MLIEPSMYTNVQNWAGDLISGNTTTGRILVVFTFLCSLAALGIYIYGRIHMIVCAYLFFDRCLHVPAVLLTQNKTSSL